MVKYFDFNKKSDLNSMTFLKAMRKKKGVYTRVQQSYTGGPDKPRTVLRRANGKTKKQIMEKGNRKRYIEKKQAERIRKEGKISAVTDLPS